ncbi:31384_t:CDS:2, partial [Gigaspora margarita]
NESHKNAEFEVDKTGTGTYLDIFLLIQYVCMFAIFFSGFFDSNAKTSQKQCEDKLRQCGICHEKGYNARTCNRK